MRDYHSDPLYREACDQLHQQALENKQKWYKDPVTGYMVFTAQNHLERGHCCESGCRHCPYGFKPPSGAS